MTCLLALDQGTSSSRAIVFDLAGQVLATAQREIRQSYPEPGWVEHDALEIWQTQLNCARQALAEAGRTARDVAAIGIGENAHIAFNDPPADFETDASYIVVTLDERCKRQQVREGWFETLDDVPKQALSMTVRQMLKARCIVSVVPHAVKADAVQNTLSKPVNNQVPATILKTHPDWHLYLDADSAQVAW